ncbi:MAG: hypothetical protein AB8B65_13570 [Kordia sp.]|uniref:hypothetical protein n=1 Tax=Kordia sp. TaxID=1965332 RepID=UPI00385ADD7D
MSPKGILITFAIVSLVLIGIMFLAVDGRNNSILDDFTTLEEKFQEAEKSAVEKNDSLERELKIIENSNFNTVKQFNLKADELVAYIESIKKEFISGQVSEQNFEKLEGSKNEILFDTITNEYSKKGKQFLAKIEAYENAIAKVYLEFPKINTKSFKLRDIRNGKDWLSYNFKDFPMIASYTKLVAMESDILNKKEAIFTKVLHEK